MCVQDKSKHEDARAISIEYEDASERRRRKRERKKTSRRSICQVVRGKTKYVAFHISLGRYAFLRHALARSLARFVRTRSESPMRKSVSATGVNSHVLSEDRFFMQRANSAHVQQSVRERVLSYDREKNVPLT